MSDVETSVPVVLIFAGHDPSGGAGLQADIEAVVSQGAHPASAVTALTVQDTRNVMRFVETDPVLLLEQARAVLEDMPVRCIKIGMIGSVGAAEVIHSILRDYAQIPVVLDPVLAASGGGQLARDELLSAMNSLLLPLTTILTPNAMESRIMAPEAVSVEERGLALLEMGPEYVLIKGGDEPGDTVENWLFSGHKLLQRYHWSRIPGKFHGSGCTLASAISGLLAHGSEPVNAVREGQEYTYQTLLNAARIGRGQLIPHRLFWADEEPPAAEVDETIVPPTIH